MRRSAADPLGDLAERFDQALAALDFSPSGGWALAISGGGDSVALMHLAAEWASRNAARRPLVLSVDHGLRRDSELETRTVMTWASRLALQATMLRWTGPKPRTGLEEKARLARYRLMGEWCVSHSVKWLMLGHTRDDQAENFLLRLARGSGVDGLSGMRGSVPLPVPLVSGVQVLRPLLDIDRAELRNYLVRRGATWFEDPMNGDANFARVRIRKLIPALAEAGICASRIVSASRHLARARLALDASTRMFLAKHAEFGSAGAAIDGASLEGLPREIGLRVLSETLLRVGGGSYRPRFERLERLFHAVTTSDFKRHTLAGCCVSRAPRARAAFGPKTIWITREKARKSVTRADPTHSRGTDLPAPMVDPD
jgi:tRNA(Ile)-lysidine synthase